MGEGKRGEEERGGLGGKLVQCRKEKPAAVFHAAKGRERVGKGRVKKVQIPMITEGRGGGG